MAIMLKADVINRAYSKQRISGITSIPTSEDNELALETLEDLAHELEEARNICLGYNFEDEPDLNAPTNIERKNKDALATILGDRLGLDFGKDMNQLKVSAAWSILSASAAQAKMTQYPSRQPIGKGNERWGHRYIRFYRPQAEAPTSCETNKMFIGDVDDFVEHFDSYLSDLEDIDTYTIEATDGLTISTSANATPDITYTIQATGGSSGSGGGLQQVQIQITTKVTARKETRIINFELCDPDGAL